MRTVKEVSQISGVSVRTLHYYDAIGLLKPTATTQAGYRLYDDAALYRLQSILLFRELGFPLREIKKLLQSPNFDCRQAIEQQITLLEMQAARTEKLLVLARKMQKEGVEIMDFSIFDTQKIDAYKAEAKEKWGDTAAYKEYEQREKAEKTADWPDKKLMQVLTSIGAQKELPPETDRVQRSVAALQQHITANYYTCTKEILRGLGEMYVADERFRQNIDGTCGEGTAAYVRRAIAVYCAK